MDKRYQTFEEFWPFYLSQHSNRTCRNLHIFGTTLGIIFFVYVLVAAQFVLIPLAFVFGYLFSWMGHFVFEKNRPATFTYPGWSFRGDFKMLYLFYTGNLESELKAHI